MVGREGRHNEEAATPRSRSEAPGLLRAFPYELTARGWRYRCAGSRVETLVVYDGREEVGRTVEGYIARGWGGFEYAAQQATFMKAKRAEELRRN